MYPCSSRHIRIVYAPATSDTALVHEVFRKLVASYTNGAAVGEVLINGFIAAGDAVGVVIAEVGWFGLDALPPLAFDHARILALATERVRPG